MTAKIVYRAELLTRNFDFEAIGDSDFMARKALREGLERHAKQYKLGPNFWQPAEIIITKFEVNAPALRDRGKIPS